MQEQLDVHVKKMNLDPYIIPYKNINSWWMKDLHEKTKIIKPLDKTIEYHLELGVGKDLVVKTQKVVIIKEKKQTISHRIKNFSS